MSIRVEQLSFAYGRRGVLRKVTAVAQAGRITALIGPNAAGKSTLLRCLIGACKPAHGQALVDGRPAHRLSPRELAGKIAYVSQRSSVSAAFTVRQVIELGRFALPVDNARVVGAIDGLELRDIADQSFTTLSVGQQQRVMLARAMAQLGPQGHLILDEPVSSMDLQHVRRCMESLRELASQGATIVLAMHDLTLASAVADDVWLLQDGRMVACGPAGEVLSPRQLQLVFGVEFHWLVDPAGVRVLVANQPAASRATTMASP